MAFGGVTHHQLSICEDANGSANLEDTFFQLRASPRHDMLTAGRMCLTPRYAKLAVCTSQGCRESFCSTLRRHVVRSREALPTPRTSIAVCRRVHLHHPRLLGIAVLRWERPQLPPTATVVCEAKHGSTLFRVDGLGSAHTGRRPSVSPRPCHSFVVLCMHGCARGVKQTETKHPGGLQALYMYADGMHECSLCTP